MLPKILLGIVIFVGVYLICIIFKFMSRKNANEKWHEIYTESYNKDALEQYLILYQPSRHNVSYSIARDTSSYLRTLNKGTRIDTLNIEIDYDFSLYKKIILVGCVYSGSISFNFMRFIQHYEPKNRRFLLIEGGMFPLKDKDYECIKMFLNKSNKLDVIKINITKEINLQELLKNKV